MTIRSAFPTIVFSLLFMFTFSIGQVFAESDVIDFELEIELKDKSKYDMEFEVKGGVIEAEYQVPGSPTLYGEEAQAMIEPLLKKLELEPNMDKNKLKSKILSIFTISENDIDDFELEVIFSGGQKLEIDE